MSRRRSMPSSHHCDGVEPNDQLELLSPLRLDEMSAITTGSSNINYNKMHNNKYRNSSTTTSNNKLVGTFYSGNSTTTPTTMDTNEITSLHDSNINHLSKLHHHDHHHHISTDQLRPLNHNRRRFIASQRQRTLSSLNKSATRRATTTTHTNAKRKALSLYLNHHQANIVVIIVVAYFGYQAECLLSSTSNAQLAMPTGPSSCPLAQGCICKWSNGKQLAQCERRNLQSIPTQLPADTQILDLSENNLIQLPQNIFQERHLTNLQKLHLSECKISYIADEAFAHLPMLNELDLSHNYLQQVPSKALHLLRHSLRRLILSHNMIHVLDSVSFSPLSRLNLLDLSSNQLSLMKPNAFHGLSELNDLKLSENRLSQLPLNVISDLRDDVAIDLFGNPWHCDCELKLSIDWMQKHNTRLQLNPTCASPPRHKDIRWQSVKSEEFMCPPVILNKQNELVVGAGSNVTLACTARGSPPLTFVWFQDEKNLTGRGSNNQTEPPPSTKLLEEKRYEIAEEMGPPNVTTSILYLMNLKLTDTSLFLCWVENAAGYTLGNFSLIVNDSPPAHLGGSNGGGGALDELGNSLMRLMRLDSSDTTSAHIALVSLSFILILVVAIVCLLVFKQMLGPRRPPKSSSPVDLKAQQAEGKLSASSKFNHHGGAGSNKSSASRMFASSDEDGATDEDEDAHTSSAASTSSGTGSTSSCRKTGHAGGGPGNTKVLAVNDLDGFIEHMRSGIINMDYHTMSPVIQFNNTLKSSTNVSHAQNRSSPDDYDHDNHQQSQQLSQLNHFPTASNSSTQPLFYNNKQPSNGSMATTLSDLSPSSGSASTSFATTTNLTIPQQQYLAAASSGTLRRQMIPPSMIQYNQQVHQHPQHSQQQQDIAAAAYPIDYQGGYNIGVGNMAPQHHLHHQQQQRQQQHLFMPPMYDCDPSQMYNHQDQLLAAQQQQQVTNHHQSSSRPSSMNELDNNNSFHHQQARGGYHNQNGSDFQIL